MQNETDVTLLISLIPSSSLALLAETTLLTYLGYTKFVKLSQQKNRTQKAKNPLFLQKPEY